MHLAAANDADDAWAAILQEMTIDEPDAGLSGTMAPLNLEPMHVDRGLLEAAQYPELAAAKAQIEHHLDKLHTLLHVKYHFDTELPLVIDGFPRADVDVVAVRLIRRRINYLKNDYRFVLELLEKLLQLQLGSKEEAFAVLPTPFARVDQVAPDGPARELQVGDKLVNFAGVTAANNNQLKAVAEKVRENEPIQIEVLRGGGIVGVSVTPAKWSGRGLLGCHIVPM